VTLSTNNVSIVVEENKQINNLPENEKIKKERTNERTCKQHSAAAQTNSPLTCSKNCSVNDLSEFSKNCLEDNYSSAVTS
jgi:hypothetical protein